MLVNQQYTNHIQKSYRRAAFPQTNAAILSRKLSIYLKQIEWKLSISMDDYKNL